MMGGEENQDDESARSMAEVLRSGAGRTILESQLLREKAMDLLLAIARGEEVPPPPADEPEAEEAPAAEGEAQTEPAVEA
jgi:hypothetical protein